MPGLQVKPQGPKHHFLSDKNLHDERKRETDPAFATEIPTALSI
jgi:hypothetical protein